MSIFGNIFKSYGKCAQCDCELLKPGYMKNASPSDPRIHNLTKKYLSYGQDINFAIASACDELRNNEYMESCKACGANFCRGCEYRYRHKNHPCPKCGAIL